MFLTGRTGFTGWIFYGDGFAAAKVSQPAHSFNFHPNHPVHPVNPVENIPLVPASAIGKFRFSS
jgi:hypothetical protein